GGVAGADGAGGGKETVGGVVDPAVEGPVGGAGPVDPDGRGAAGTVGFFGAQGFSLVLILSSFPFSWGKS
ncbi:MAG: hypothetical protein WA719_08490, partial [Thermoplasmata archaeon]